MSSFVDAVFNSVTHTWNGALSHANTGEHNGLLGLFFKGIRGLSEERLSEYLEDAYADDFVDAMVMTFHIRDREGKGERKLGRDAFRWWFLHHTDDFMKIFSLIPEYGRWDDLLEYISLEEVVSMYAKQLEEDYNNMNEGLQVSLCAKWIPSEASSQDKKYRFTSELCAKMNINHKTLRKKYISPLREYLNIVERYMCSGQWGDIDFNKVPSQAMRKLAKAFDRNDKYRFNTWKEGLATGESKVNAKLVYPHELVKDYCGGGGDQTLINAQAEVLISEAKKLGVFNESMVLADVSPSMENGSDRTVKPMHVSLGMAAIISRCANDAYKNRVITFHETPTLFTLSGKNFCNDVQELMRAPWGGSTDFFAAHQLIVNLCKTRGVKDEDMVKRLFVISDMQFNSASRTHTTHQAIEQLYTSNGYTPPQLIYWNVNSASLDFPVIEGMKNTALISGYATSVMKALFKTGEVEPYSIMKETLNDERYNAVRDKLVNE